LNPFRPRRVRLAESGWAGYNGHVGTVLFQDGVSVEPVSFREQQIIGGIIRIESMDDGEEGAQLGPSAELLRSRDIDAGHDRVSAADTGVAAGPHGEVRLAAERYTRDELEAIADRRGITGLRDIAMPYGIKGRSINELIGEILDMQAKGEAPPPTAESAPDPAAQ
jgi:hypothetical protein